MSFLHYIFLPLLSYISWPWVHEFISGLSMPFNWLIFLFLWQYHTILMTILRYSLKSGSLIPSAPFFFLKIALTIWGLLWFHTSLKFFCFSSVKNALGNLTGITLIMLFAATGMGLEIIILSEVSQTERQIYDIIYI